MTPAELLHDLGAFCDPPTEPKILEVQAAFDVQMVRNGDDIRFRLNRRSGQVVVDGPDGQKYPSLAGLLAGATFADVRSLAAMQKRVFADFADEKFIEPEGEITYPDGRASPISIDAFDDLLRLRGNGKTRIYLLDGQAGVGKTSLIKRLLVRRARAAIQPPLIHVESRGSRLFGLAQLLAATLDTARAKFTFDQVPALLRHGLIHVAIDGFDELVDSEGYADAWSALSDFLDEIGNSGTVILSGRDTFFDQQAFNERLAFRRDNVALHGVRLEPITPSKAREYLKKNGWGETELNDVSSGDLLRPGSYVLRPYFLATLADLPDKTWRAITSSSTIRKFLLDRFLARESELIRQRTSLSAIDARTLLAKLFSELALEMAASETDAVDTSFIELLIEIVFGDRLSITDVGRLVHKAGSIALLEGDSRRGYRKFPHTEISNFFLSQGVVQSTWSPQLRRVLSRASFQLDFLSLFSEEFAELNQDSAKKFSEMLDLAFKSEGSSGDRLDTNMAALRIGTLNNNEIGGVAILKNLYVIDAALVGEADTAMLDSVVINRLDARGANLSAIKFIDSTVSTLIADTETRLGEYSPQVTHVQETAGGSVVNLRGAQAEDWIKRHSQNEGDVRPGRSELLLRKAASIFVKRYAVSDEARNRTGRIFRDDAWPLVEAILYSHGRIQKFSNEGSGTQKDFIRILNPIGLLREEDDIAREIWRQVRALDCEKDA